MMHYSHTGPTATVLAHDNQSESISAGEVVASALLGQNDDYLDVTNVWEYEEITIEKGSSGLGFTVAGGTDNPHYKNDSSIFITKLIPDGPAAQDGRFKLEDIIVRVGDTDLIGVKHSKAVNALKNSGNRVQLLIKRRKSSSGILDDHNNIPNGPSSTSNNKPPLSKLNSTPTRLFTSTLETQANQALPSNRNSDLTNLRGSIQYSTVRDHSTTKAPKLRGASSSLSLQRADEADSNRATAIYSKENISTTYHSKSTSAIPTDGTRSITKLPRTVILQRTNKGLGFNIVGGAAGAGTFISCIVPGSAAERSNKLHCGDQVLSVNGIDLRSATHEEAATSLRGAGQTVKLVVKHRPEEYIKIENRLNYLRERNMLSTGTLQTSQKKSLHARALFDYDPAKDSGLPSKGLSFKFGDILHIINASDDEWWQARKVLENGQDDTIHGIIPSKWRVEKRERARLKSVKFTNWGGSAATLERRRKKFSFSKKFPFMKSRENLGEFYDYDLTGSQSNDRGILMSTSATSVNNSEKCSMRNDLDEVILSYEPVLQQQINYARPVSLHGPINDEIENLREDLACDDRFHKMELIVPYTTRPPKEGEVDGVKYHFVSMPEMKRDLAQHKFVEAGELKNHLYGTSIDSIRDVADAGKHCLLNVSPKAIKRLHDADLFPVVIFIKPKSIESLLEMNKRWTLEEAIGAMDSANRLEQEFGTYFTATIQMENPNDMLNKIMTVITQQSGPRIWIPTTFESLNVVSCSNRAGRLD